MSVITWTIEEMACYPQKDGYESVVYFLKWNCTAKNGFRVSITGSDHLLPSPTDSFTPYDQLTEAQVLGWLWASGVDKDAVESNLTETLASMPDPVSVSLPLPWSNA